MSSLIFLKSDPYYGDNAQTALKCRDLVTKKSASISTKIKSFTPSIKYWKVLISHLKVNVTVPSSMVWQVPYMRP